MRITAAGVAAVGTRAAFAVAILATAYLVRYWLAASWGLGLANVVAVVLLVDAAFTWLFVEWHRRRHPAR